MRNARERAVASRRQLCFRFRKFPRRLVHVKSSVVWNVKNPTHNSLRLHGSSVTLQVSFDRWYRGITRLSQASVPRSPSSLFFPSFSFLLRPFFPYHDLGLCFPTTLQGIFFFFFFFPTFASLSPLVKNQIPRTPPAPNQEQSHGCWTITSPPILHVISTIL